MLIALALNEVFLLMNFGILLIVFQISFLVSGFVVPFVVFLTPRTFTQSKTLICLFSSVFGTVLVFAKISDLP